jgi:hypothetical protein
MSETPIPAVTSVETVKENEKVYLVRYVRTGRLPARLIQSDGFDHYDEPAFDVRGRHPHPRG